MADELTVKAEPFESEQRAIDRIERDVRRQPAARELIGGANRRLLSVEPLEPARRSIRPRPWDRYRATWYDYGENRAVVVEGRLGEPGKETVTETAAQPLPSPEEFEAAVAVVAQDAELGPAVRDGKLQPYRAMPPLVNEELPDGRVERTLTVGLLPADGATNARHQIVGLNMIRRRVERYSDGAPAGAQAAEQLCGAPSANQSTTGRGVPGQAKITVLKGLDQAVVARGRAALGVLGHRRLRGRAAQRVLPRQAGDAPGARPGPERPRPEQPVRPLPGLAVDGGHVPGPGPESGACLQAVLGAGQDDPGHRFGLRQLPGCGRLRRRAGGCPGQRDGGRVVPLCQRVAAACRRDHPPPLRLRRHRQLLRLPPARPSRLLALRLHGGDVRQQPDLRAQRPAAAAGHQRLAAAAHKRRWRVQNANSGRGYTIIPGTNDGTARGDAYAKGDVWLLRYRRGQIDDYPLAGGTEIQIDKYLNRESIHRQDVVVWYGAHFTHDASQEGAGAGHDHIVGPDLVPHDW